MTEIFDEVDEDVRKDELIQLWRRWGPYLVGTAAAIIIGWTSFVLWRDHVESGLAENSTAFEAAVALAEIDPDAAITAFENLGTGGPSGYAALSSFSQAAIYLERGEWQAAVALYDRVAADSSLDTNLQDLAVLLAAMTMADHNDAADVRGRLEPLVIDGGIWSHSAREILALLDFRAGDLDAAESTFSDLSFSEEAPAGIRQRAQEMLELIDVARTAIEPAIPAGEPQADGSEKEEAIEEEEEDQQ